jgi:hypothetical protein
MATVGVVPGNLAGMNADPRTRRNVAHLRSDQRVDASRGAEGEIAQLGFERFA